MIKCGVKTFNNYIMGVSIMYIEYLLKSQYVPFKLEKKRKSPIKDFNPNLSQSSYLSTYRS